MSRTVHSSEEGCDPPSFPDPMEPLKFRLGSYEQENVVDDILSSKAEIDRLCSMLLFENRITSDKSWKGTLERGREDVSQRKSKGEATKDGNLMELLSDDLLLHVASFLNVGSLKSCLLVSKHLNVVLSRNEAGWTNHCYRLWNRKVHISRDAQALLQEDSRRAYRISCMDARIRHVIRCDELIYDPKNRSGTIWHFRFKQAAGVEWTRFDPWWRGQVGDETRRMVFLADGTVRQVLKEPQQTGVDHNHDKLGSIRLVLPFSDSVNRSGLEIRWCFVSQPLDLPAREQGVYIRLTIAGREVPTYCVHRSPNGNWGFVLENCWGMFASFPLPPRKKEPQTQQHQQPTRLSHAPHPDQESAGRVIQRMRLRRPSNGGDPRWINVDETDTEEEDNGIDRRELCAERPQKRLRRPEGYMDPDTATGDDLLEDKSLTVTTRWQWREALLYNLGSSRLPNGPNAREEFDRAWKHSMQQMGSFGFPSAQNYSMLSDRLRSLIQ